MSQQVDALQAQLNEYLEAYEIGRERDENSDLNEFLPAVSNPLYKETRRELVRMDLEYSWAHGRPRRIGDYVAIFPDLFDDPTSAQEITFEEYRLRMLAGENPSALEYERRYGVRTFDWPGSDAHVDDYAKTVVTTGGADKSRQDMLDTYRGRPDTPPVEWDMHDEVFPPLDKNDRRSLSGETAKALLQQDVHHSLVEVNFLLKEALTSLPDVGTRFLNFHLIAVLGEGGFGRVYLARQGGLANRLVALKITINLQGEEQKLAQLQHTNVVPIYSAHKEGSLYAVCMPYFGPTTLADVVRSNRKAKRVPTTGASVVETLRRREAEFAAKANSAQLSPAERVQALTKLEESDYVGAVLWLGERIADGLIHAHEYGILHGDLKPANILLTDDGEPMLLDFNLATDLKVDAGLGALRVGGTIPYMAPEHLQALKGGDRRRVDARSDVYSLGVILFELLTGRLPFDVPSGPMFEILPGMIAERMQSPPRLRQYNRAVTGAVESIVRHCLHPDQSKRYQSVQELHDDLQCYRQHLPLQHAPEVSLLERGQKWMRRHPRLAAPNTIIMVLVCLLAAVMTPGAWNTWQQWQTDRQKLLDAKVLADASAIENEETRKKKELAEQLAEREKKNTEEAKERERIVQEKIDALNRFRRFHASADVAQDLLDCVALLRMRPEMEGIEKTRLVSLDADCRSLLKEYDILDSPAWQRQPRVTALPEAETDKLRADVAGLLFALAHAESCQASKSPGNDGAKRLADAVDLNQRARACFSERAMSCALVLQQESLARLTGNNDEADHLKADAEKLLTNYETLARQIPLTDDKEFVETLRRRLKVRKDADFYWTALELASRRRFDKAGATLAEATRRFPSHFGSWQLWALCHQAVGECATTPKKLDHFREAQACWNVCAALKPERSDVLYWRAMVLIQLDKPADAQADLERLTHPANDLDPYRNSALYQEAVLLAARPENEQKAYVKLNQILARDKEHVDARLMRGMIKARRELRDEAVADAELALKYEHDRTPARYYQAASIYALNAGMPQGQADDAKRAVELLSKAVRGGYGATRFENDRNFRHIRDLPEFRKLIDEARKLD